MRTACNLDRIEFDRHTRGDRQKMQEQKTVQLSRDEHVPGRPFSDPEHSPVDLGHLRTMLDRLRHHLDKPEGLPEDQRPVIIEDEEELGYYSRTVISLPDRLRSGEGLTVVGFFGVRQPNEVEEEVTAVDDALVDDLPKHNYVAAYCSMLLGEGPHQGNLILMTEESGIERWKEGERHAYAAEVLAPKAYSAARAYNGRVAPGWQSGADLVLDRAKYYDFAEDPWWRGIREGTVE